MKILRLQCIGPGNRSGKLADTARRANALPRKSLRWQGRRKILAEDLFFLFVHETAISSLRNSSLSQASFAEPKFWLSPQRIQQGKSSSRLWRSLSRTTKQQSFGAPWTGWFSSRAPSVQNHPMNKTLAVIAPHTLDDPLDKRLNDGRAVRG